jgi:hypothetical protein
VGEGQCIPREAEIIMSLIYNLRLRFSSLAVENGGLRMGNIPARVNPCPLRLPQAALIAYDLLSWPGLPV